MDRSLVSVIDMEMKKTAFDNIKSKEPTTLTFSLDKLFNILKTIKKGKTLKLEATEMSLKTIIDGKREFETSALVNPEEKAPDISKLESNATVEMTSGILSEGLTDASIVADSIVFRTKGKEFTMEAMNEKREATRTTLSAKDAVIGGSEESSRYPNDYLTKAQILFNMFETVKIGFKSDSPIKFTMDNSNLKAEFVIAPRLSD